MSHIRQAITNKNIDTASLIHIDDKSLHYEALGDVAKPPIFFVHGLGASTEFYSPLIHVLSLEKSHSLHLFDLEGHGLSPTSPLSKLSIASFASDLNGVFKHANVDSGATLIAHSMGALVALQFALLHPEKVSKLVLLGPPPSPLPEAKVTAMHAQADATRSKGMTAVIDAIVASSISDETRKSNPLAVAAVRLSLLAQDPEGYAKACSALAEAGGLHLSALRAKTLLITGGDDKFSPPKSCEMHVEAMGGNAELVVLEDIGHWHIFEDLQGVAQAVKRFLQ